MKLLYILLPISLFAAAYLYFNKSKNIEVRTTLSRLDFQEQRQEAFDYLNNLRSSLGLVKLTLNSKLTKAAQGHANYLVANNESSHYEIKGHKNFIGKSVVDRAIYANFSSTTLSENLSTNTKDAKNSISELFSAIYHRFAFLSPNIDTVGVGVAQNKKDLKNNAFVYVMGNSNLERLCSKKGAKVKNRYYFNLCRDKNLRVPKELYDNSINSLKKVSPKIICYPYNGQKGVSPVFYEESPDPLPNYRVSGFPISVEFNDYYFNSVKLVSFKLYSNNKEVKNVKLLDKYSDPNRILKSNQFALFPLKRLEFNKEYRVKIIYIANNKRYKKEWSFKTIKPNGKLYKVDNQKVLYLSKNIDNILYFPPKNRNDLIMDIEFPSALNIDFLDHNTVKIASVSNSMNFTLKTNNKRVNIVIK